MLALGLLAGLLAKTGHLPGASPKATSTTLTHPAAIVSAAAVEACRGSYEAVQTAVAEYETETGSGPTDIRQLQSLLHGVVVSSQYTISIDRSLAGEIDIATPGHPASPGESNCAYAGQ